ncbi:MAG: carbohydrate-binding protein [Oscillospiraceae bacterium]|nr:carbohydrate-binding protein [Oscillospiraceae bacterium]
MKKTFRQWLAGITAAATAFSGLLAFQPAQTSAAGKLLAFPGAVGGGKYATGGRGGEVYHVTNLNDSGAGSFRDAVSKSGRIVVFDVSGTIELQSAVVCQSNVTIAGQTAPGGSGITLKNYKLGLGGSNCIVRYISSRPGPYKATSSGNDAWGGAGGADTIIDHCSLGWASDEQWGLYSKNDNYTVQYSVIGPANSWGGHDKGIHGFGIMFGRSNFSWDHNLILHSVSRNFRGKIPGTSAADFTNNVIYDWGYQTTYGTIGHVNYVNNTLKAGNSTASGFHYAQVSDNENFKLYLTGNRILNKDMSVRNAENANWSAISYSGSKNESSTRVNDHFPITVNGEDVSTTLTCESAAASYDHVVSFAGNGISPTRRTAIDQQCAADTKNGTGYCSGTAAYDSSVTDLDKYHIQCGVTYTYPAAVLQKTITDKDNDGMDDAWEEARGLDPNDPTDYAGDYLGDGYMNIEYYINDLTVDSFPAGTVEVSPEAATVTARSAFDQIEAEDFNTQEGIQTEDTSDASGSQNIGYIENGDYVMYKKLDFGDGAQSFTARASGNACVMELYIDTMTTPLAKLRYDGTGSFGSWEDFTAGIPKITGTHNLYIRFTGGEGYLMNLNWFTFGKDRIPVSGKLVYDLQVLDSERSTSYAIAYDTTVGSMLFGDRDFTVAELPAELEGAESILTACDSKNYSGDCAAFEAAADATLYIGLDSRVETIPAWMADFRKLGQTMTSSNDVTFDLYALSLKAGDKITLSSNGQSYMCVNYTVFLQPAAETEATTTTAETTTTTEETTEATASTEATTESTTEATTTQETTTVTTASETVPTETTTAETQPTTTAAASVYGDTNDDDAVDIMDVIALNKYLLGSASLTPELKAQADVDRNGTIDATDSLTILKFVVELLPSLPVN